MINRIAGGVVLGWAVLAAAPSRAAEFEFSGVIQNHNDVVRIGFSLTSDTTDVRVWTDSYENGANFDPITAVWLRPGGELVGENDDQHLIGAGQSVYDSGLAFPMLPAGDYVFTVAAFPNFSLTRVLLGDGFLFDNQAPVALADWCQPAAVGCYRGRAGLWRVHLTGVDDAVELPPPPPPVPEPATWGLMVLGLAALRAFRR